MNRPSTLPSYAAQYNKLKSFWDKARSVIIEAAKTPSGSELYQMVSEDMADEVRLRVCGALAYVRFKHDLKQGRLEYGALPMAADGRPTKYVRIENVAFDSIGNVGGHFHFDDDEDQAFRHLHLRLLATIVPQIVDMYFSETQDGSAN